MTTLSQVITTAPDGLRPFLQFVERRGNNDNDMRASTPLLFATYAPPNAPALRVRVVTASKLGRIGITECLHEETTPQIYVPAAQLSQFLPTPYPMRKKVRRPRGTPTQRIHAEARVDAAQRTAALMEQFSVDCAEVARRIASASGIPITHLFGASRERLLTCARRSALGVIASRNHGLSLPVLGRAIGCHHTTTLHSLREIGLHASVTGEFDLPYLRALWLKGRMPIGHEPGQMPDDVAARLGRFVTIDGGELEPSNWTEFRRYLGLAIARARIVAERERLQCAA
jgi:hypothetical protein